MSAVRCLPLILFLLAPPSLAQTLTGTATIGDGDTLALAGQALRLAYIDAPEAAQECGTDSDMWACGAEATEFLTQFVAGQEVACTLTGFERDGVANAVCRRGTIDIGLAMIEQGHAIALADAPEGYLIASELRRQHRLGLWRSDFVEPARWRAEHPDEPAGSPASLSDAVAMDRPTPRRSADPKRVWRNAMGCAIKGNRSRRGEWIYHLPGQEYYDQTRPEELFCTEGDARRAGYRRAKN